MSEFIKSIFLSPTKTRQLMTAIDHSQFVQSVRTLLGTSFRGPPSFFLKHFCAWKKKIEDEKALTGEQKDSNDVRKRGKKENQSSVLVRLYMVIIDHQVGRNSLLLAFTL